MHYQRRNLLTIVISPLQALMKDQVDNFSRQTAIDAALYGLLTMPERGAVLEAIRLGDIGILYVSPEQLRNHSFIKTVDQREIGAWVFDEAHCLSKWGHDFRPDYLYAIRFIRENAVVLEYLRANRSVMLPGSSLSHFVPQTLAAPTVWQANLRRLLHEWIEETGDSPQPAAAIEEYLYEALADQTRARNLADGIFLSTVHSVKGLEFDHVFMLGDSWPEKRGAEAEEERRLFYVGMSWARQTLHLFSLADRRNPHVSLLEGEYLLSRTVRPEPGGVSSEHRYTLLGLTDLYLDFAGRKRENHPARLALGRLQAGYILAAEVRNDQVELVDGDGLTVARPSKAARSVWADRLACIREIRVVAMVRRCLNDSTDNAFADRCNGDHWEVPVVELVWQPKAGKGAG